MKILIMVLSGCSVLMAAAGTSVAISGNAISIGSGGWFSEVSPACATFASHGFLTVFSNAANLNSHKQGLTVLIR